VILIFLTNLSVFFGQISVGGSDIDLNSFGYIIFLSHDLYSITYIKGGVGKFEKPARDTLFVIFHGMLLTS